uniref:xylan 1,4-beta-xylosidase n=1 Tax=Humicola insolens TaxID=85995 RepID=A0A0C5AKM5_HUMIN|nr:Xyl3A [Humicola insolens]
MTRLTSIGVLAAYAAGALAGVLPDCSKPPLSLNKICDQNASPRERAEALVAAMTVEEKLANLVSKAAGVPRLGFPAYNWWSEALHGVAGAPGISFAPPFDYATSFPMPLMMAAAFDDDLIEKIAVVIGNESRAFGNNDRSGIDYWTPDVNPYRDPRWGRGSETPGEDVLVIKRYTKHLLRGLEGTSKTRRIIATCKHYAGYDLESWQGTTRHDFDARITPQELAEYYMQPFQQCARDSKVGSIMCSYNRVNGVPACASDYLLNKVLREHWNWTESNNYITSDCEAVADVSLNHKYAPTLAAGTAMCFNNGMDLSCEYEGSSDIPGAWNSGALNETIVDRALVRLFQGLVHGGYFDGPTNEWASLGRADVDTPYARQLALQSAIDGLVLLKNDRNTLPLPLRKGSKVAMIGFWADDGPKLKGIYSGPSPFIHTPVWAAREAGYEVAVAPGPILQTNAAQDNWTEAALAAAKKSDYILYFGGIDTNAVNEGVDRLTIAWPEAQLTLINKLAALRKPLVIIQLGDQLDNTPLLKLQGAPSILWANWPGQDGGPAIISVINGTHAPAGRLPVTQYPANYTEIVPMTDMNLRPNPSTGNPGRTYKWYPHAVQPFGTGLHYTTFDARFDRPLPAPGKPGTPGTKPVVLKLNIQSLLADCKNTYKDTCALPPLEVQVTNRGPRHTSDYVALVFITETPGPKPHPLKSLATYGRLRNIKPGRTERAKLEWTVASLARHDKDGNSILYPGRYTLVLDVPQKDEVVVELSGKEEVLDVWPVDPNLKN